jgi:Protein of unknown function (DUF5672)
MWKWREKTAAQSVAEELRRKGIARADITRKDIAHIYNGLKVFPDAPDLSCTARLLPAVQSPIRAESADGVLGLILETRCHPNLESVVQIFRRIGIRVQVFHGQNNRRFILESAIAGLAEKGEVSLMQLNTEHLSSPQYNALFLSPAFWDLLETRSKVLVFQTDAMLCPNSPYTLQDFLSFDYIGSRWHRDRPVGLTMDGGNGGLSLRDWRKSYECLRRFPPDLWPAGEDGYFAFHVDLIGGKVGRNRDCERFSTQHYFEAESFGAHHITSLDQQRLAEFLKYCPSARAHLLDGI